MKITAFFLRPAEAAASAAERRSAARRMFGKEEKKERKPAPLRGGCAKSPAETLLVLVLTEYVFTLLKSTTWAFP